MGNGLEGVHPYAPVFRDVSDVQKHAEAGMENINRLIDGSIPLNSSETQLAEQADSAFKAAADQIAPQPHGTNVLPKISPANVKLDKWRALVTAMNPEGGLVNTVGLSASALAKSALVRRGANYSLLERGYTVAKSSIYGGFVVSLAASKPLDGRLPGVTTARRMAGRVARSFI